MLIAPNFASQSVFSILPSLRGWWVKFCISVTITTTLNWIHAALSALNWSCKSRIKHWPGYKQLKSHFVVWLLINRDVRLIRYEPFHTKLLLICSPLERYCFNWLIPNYLFNFSLFFFFILQPLSPSPRLNLSIRGTFWQTAVTSGPWLEGGSRCDHNSRHDVCD